MLAKEALAEQDQTEPQETDELALPDKVDGPGRGVNRSEIEAGLHQSEAHGVRNRSGHQRGRVAAAGARPGRLTEEARYERSDRRESRPA